ncbi:MULTISPECIES: TerB family tellurite resistance protein [Novilysobacter]|uniref:tellurite resistance TerB family protein n=1 Tax=Novilysobacter TaxID=3382699 RepID=UPI002ED79BC7
MTDWFENLKGIVNRYEPPADPHALPRAAAALLLEMAVTDDGGERIELDVVHQAMRAAFGINPAELQALLDQAHDARKQSVSMYDFTRELRVGLAPEQRAELVEWLWRVAFADARLATDEEHMVRRVADLLGVSHSEFIRRKLVVKAGRQGTEATGAGDR